MELNMNIFKNFDESNYFLLRTKNYHKTNMKYSKKKPLLNIIIQCLIRLLNQLILMRNCS